MVDIPIIVTTPQNQPLSGQDVPEQSPVSTVHVLRPNPQYPAQAGPAGSSMISHATQTDSEAEVSAQQHSPRTQSPEVSRSGSPRLFKHPLSTWSEQLRYRLKNATSCHPPGPKAVDAGGQSLLSAPVESPKRPCTPQADLYHGQSSATFGVTFESEEPHFRKGGKPAACAYSYEDQKHRMVMDWLERKR